MDRLKILHVVSIVAPRYAGAGIASQLMARYQAKEGHKVAICTTNVDFPNGNPHGTLRRTSLQRWDLDMAFPGSIQASFSVDPALDVAKIRDYVFRYCSHPRPLPFSRNICGMAGRGELEFRT